MSIVMGVDQLRAQITAEWIDMATGEISRARVRPADRGGVRRFLARFAGQQLEVALEARTGWRFLVEELRAAGAVVHLAEPAETAALRGNKKRANSDRADARHHRELLLAGRLPESWIPPDQILDLRAQISRCRHSDRTVRRVASAEARVRTAPPTLAIVPGASAPRRLESPLLLMKARVLQRVQH